VNQQPHILEALRLSDLYRQVCRYAGVPLPPAPAAEDRFILRTGAEPPGLFARLLEEAFAEGGTEFLVRLREVGPDGCPPVAGQILVCSGFASACPAEELRRAARPGGGPLLLFAMERRDAECRLLDVTWAAVPEEEPPPEAGFRAAVLRCEVGT